MKESTKKYFIKDVYLLDLEILRLWIRSDAELTKFGWSEFIRLLETRVLILKCLKSQGAILKQEHCVPGWLNRLSEEETSLSLRDLKIRFEKIKNQVRLLDSELREDRWHESKSV